MKNNYPIKYALVPIVEEIGWKGNYYQLENYGLMYYIVSKCYLVGEEKDYKENGSFKTLYNVVFPYKECRNELIRTEPEFYPINNKCMNCFQTDELFSTFEEASRRKEEKNSELERKKIKNFKKEFQKTAQYYDTLEKMIQFKTEDLLINQKQKEQSVIMYQNGTYKKVNTSLYEMIDLYNRDDFIVYSLSEEAYQKLVEEQKGDENEKFNHTPLLINDGFSKVTKIISSVDENYFLYEGTILKDSCYIDDKKDYSITFYTLENSDDIMNSYQSRFDSNIKLYEKK